MPIMSVDFCLFNSADQWVPQGVPGTCEHSNLASNTLSTDHISSWRSQTHVLQLHSLSRVKGDLSHLKPIRGSPWPHCLLGARAQVVHDADLGVLLQSRFVHAKVNHPDQHLTPPQNPSVRVDPFAVLLPLAIPQ